LQTAIIVHLNVGELSNSLPEAITHTYEGNSKSITFCPSNPAPKYPEIARMRGEQGRVMLHVDVDASGHPTATTIATSSGYPELDSAAVSAVKNWCFVPAQSRGVPVASTKEVPIRFQLEPVN
jgi:protein TonB